MTTNNNINNETENKENKEIDPMCIDNDSCVTIRQDHLHDLSSKKIEKKKTYPYSFYRRKLPCPPSIAFSSKEGKDLFKESLGDGYMEGYFELAEQFRTQDEPAFCGLSTLTMVLNTLNIDPKRIWKGPWRWYNESMLDCCLPLDIIKDQGIILDEFVCIAACNGVDSIVRRPNKQIRYDKLENGEDDDKPIIEELKNDKNDTKYYDLNQFRDDVKEACRSNNEPILVVSYSRKELLQTGDGHFTPIGGYNKEKDLVLLMDVARYKYPPHWVSLELVYNSMCRLDSVTHKNRGWLMMRKSTKKHQSLFFIWNNEQINHVRETINTTVLNEASKLENIELRNKKLISKINPKPKINDYDIANVYYTNIPDSLCTDNCQCTDNEIDILHCIFNYLPNNIHKMFTTYVEKFNIILSESHNKLKNEIINGIRDTKLYPIVKEILENHKSIMPYNGNLRIEMATLIILIIPNTVWRRLKTKDAANKMIHLMQINEKYKSLIHEVKALQQQLRFLQDIKINNLCLLKDKIKMNQKDKCNHCKDNKKEEEKPNKNQTSQKN